MVKSSSAKHISAIADSQQNDSISGFSARLQQAAQKKGLSQSDLSRVTGLKSARIHEYWHGPKTPTAQNLFAIARALDVSAEWLSLGRGPASHHLVDSGEAEWVNLPVYDPKNFGEQGRGEPLSSVSFRRDWLNRTLMTDKGLWIAVLPNDYLPQDLREGDHVICCDVTYSELKERHLVIWYIPMDNYFPIARWSVRAKSMHWLTDDDGELWVYPDAVQRTGESDADQLIPIGRILGRPLAAIR